MIYIHMYVCIHVCDINMSVPHMIFMIYIHDFHDLMSENLHAISQVGLFGFFLQIDRMFFFLMHMYVTLHAI